jgi:serine/threonine protein kinase
MKPTNAPAGKHPYHSNEFFHMLEELDRSGPMPSLPETCSAELRDLADQCLQKNALNRPSAQALLTHPFLEHASALTPESWPYGTLENPSEAELDTVAKHMVEYYYAHADEKHSKLQTTTRSTSSSSASSVSPHPPLASLQYCCERVAEQLGSPLDPVKKAFGKYWRATRKGKDKRQKR